MGQRNLLDRPFLQFQTGINIVVRRLPAEVGVDGEDGGGLYAGGAIEAVPFSKREVDVRKRPGPSAVA